MLHPTQPILLDAVAAPPSTLVVVDGFQLYNNICACVCDEGLNLNIYKNSYY